MSHLFVLDLDYIAGLALVEEHLDAHREYLTRNYSDGTFLASGRKEPRTGGVILAQGTCEQVKEVIATDPFVVHGAARYTRPTSSTTSRSRTTRSWSTGRHGTRSRSSCPR